MPPGANTDTPENRWAVIGHHRQGVPQIDGMHGYLDVLAVGDDLYLREMNTFATDEKDAVALRTLPFTTSQAGVLQDWNRAQLDAGAIYYQDLVGPTVESTTPNCVPSPTNDCITQSEDEKLVIQRLPEVRLIAQKELGLGLMGDFQGSFTNFQRPLGLAGVRGDFKPQVELRLPLGPLAVRIGARRLPRNRLRPEREPDGGRLHRPEPRRRAVHRSARPAAAARFSSSTAASGRSSPASSTSRISASTS